MEESLILKAWKSFALGFYGLNGLGLLLQGMNQFRVEGFILKAG